MKKIMAVILLGLSGLFGPLAAGAAESSVDKNAQYFASIAQESPGQLAESMRVVYIAESEGRFLQAVERAVDLLNKNQKPDAAKLVRAASKMVLHDCANHKHACRPGDLKDEAKFLSDFLRPGPVPSGS